MWDARLAKTGLAKPNGVGRTKTVLVRPMRNKGSTKTKLVQAAKGDYSSRSALSSVTAWNKGVGADGVLFLPRGLEQMECSSFSGNTLSDTDSTKMVLGESGKERKEND